MKNTQPIKSMMKKIEPTIQLGTTLVNSTTMPYIIAEIGVNHEGSLEQAKLMIDYAKSAGANAAKFQSYKAEKLASKNSPAYWDTSKETTKSQYELFKKFDSFGEEEYLHLANYCQQIGIDFLSTPFDDDALEFLTPLVPFFKVASADITNIPFLRKIASKNKPVVLSTGASNIQEINLALYELHHNGCKDIALLHCILNYPTEDNNAHLKMITGLKNTYPEYIIGYSDHTLPDDHMTSLTASFLLGASIIEKHFTLDKLKEGNDHYHSMNAEDLKVFVSNAEKIIKLNGNEVDKKALESEEISRKQARRSIVIIKALKAGSIISPDHLTYKRPGSGISPIYWDDVIGKSVNQDLSEDTILEWSHLSL